MRSTIAMLLIATLPAAAGCALEDEEGLEGELDGELADQADDGVELAIDPDLADVDELDVMDGDPAVEPDGAHRSKPGFTHRRHRHAALHREVKNGGAHEQQHLELERAVHCELRRARYKQQEAGRHAHEQADRDAEGRGTRHFARRVVHKKGTEHS